MLPVLNAPFITDEFIGIIKIHNIAVICKLWAVSWFEFFVRGIFKWVYGCKFFVANDVAETVVAGIAISCRKYSNNCVCAEIQLWNSFLVCVKLFSIRTLQMFHLFYQEWCTALHSASAFRSKWKFIAFHEIYTYQMDQNPKVEFGMFINLFAGYFSSGEVLTYYVILRECSNVRF